MSNLHAKKSCVVPKCTNTTTNAPEKLFFHVPKDVQMRKKWIKAIKRLDSFGAKSTVYCCEDHFDIESDMENYVKYKLVGGRLILKKGTVPHKFECQKKKVDKPKRSAVQKRNKIKKNEKLLSTSQQTKKPEEVFVACCEEEIVLEDSLNLKSNDQCLKISKKSKGVQVKRDKGVHKSTMTDKNYLKEQSKTISCPETVSVGNITDTSSSLSTHKMYNLDKYFLNPDDHLDSVADNSDSKTHFFRNYMQKAALLCISREPQLLLGLHGLGFWFGDKFCYYNNKGYYSRYSISSQIHYWLRGFGFMLPHACVDLKQVDLLDSVVTSAF